MKCENRWGNGMQIQFQFDLSAHFIRLASPLHVSYANWKQEDAKEDNNKGKNMIPLLSLNFNHLKIQQQIHSNVIQVGFR